MKKGKTVQEHMASIASKGGKTLLASKGKGYFSKLAKRRWAKEAIKNKGKK